MAKEPKQVAGGFQSENTGGVLAGFLAEEDEFDRPSLWRLGSWGAASVGAVIIALLASQSSIGWRREQIAASSDLARQAQQLQSVTKESQSEARRLASAIDTLNSDRDRLYTRVTVLEQGLDSVTGSIARQTAAATLPQIGATASAPAEPPQASPAAAPVVAPVTTTAAPPAPAEKPRPSSATMEPAPATVASVGQATATTPPVMPAPLMASKSMLAPPDTPVEKLTEPQSPAKTTVTASPMPEVVATTEDGEPDESAAAGSKLAVQRTEFGVDVGGANSVGGLRALWRGLLKSKSNAPLLALRPIIVVKENNNGLGMQLRLVAGPLNDAGTAAKICATLIENQRTCETSLFDGQRLTMRADDPPATVKPAARRQGSAKRAAVVEEPAKKPEPPSTVSTVTSTVSSLFSKRSP